MVDLIEQCQVACNELIDVTGRAAIQAVLQLSAMEAAGGPPQQGKRRVGDVVFYGRQPGQVFLSDRKLEVERPRLRSKGPKSHEVEVPAYAAMQNPTHKWGRGCWTLLLHGVSTRNYKAVIPEMAETAGVSRSAVSRAAIEASEAEVEALLDRRFDELKLLVIYIDGLIFGDYTMIGAVGVDVEGNKHVLGIREGATENSTVVTALLEDIVARGVDPQPQDAVRHRRLEGAAGRHQRRLRRRSAGATLPRPQAAQRARLSAQGPDRPQVKSVLRAAWKLAPKEGMARIKKLAAWLDQKYPSAAGSLLEGLEECFTINRLDVPPSLCRCLATTNIIESPHAGVRIQTRRVTHWQNGRMVLRWMASAFLRTEKRLQQDHGLSRSVGLGSDPQPYAGCFRQGRCVVTST